MRLPAECRINTKKKDSNPKKELALKPPPFLPRN